MLDLSLVNITMFFVIIGICLIFVSYWIIKSEARIKICKNEMKKLKNDLESSDRERFVLSEKITNLETAQINTSPDPQGNNTSELEVHLNDALEKNDALKEENKKLKKELAEAKSSLEEVYKALV